MADSFTGGLEMDPEGHPQGRKDDQREAVTVGGSLNPHKLYMNYPGLLKEQAVLLEVPACRLIFFKPPDGLYSHPHPGWRFAYFPICEMSASSNRSQMEIDA